MDNSVNKWNIRLMQFNVVALTPNRMVTKCMSYFRRDFVYGVYETIPRYVALPATTPFAILLLYLMTLSLADTSVLYISNSIDMPYATRLIIPGAQRSWRGVYWLHLVRPSVGLSIRLGTKSSPLCISYNNRRIYFIFTHLIKQSFLLYLQIWIFGKFV